MIQLNLQLQQKQFITVPKFHGGLVDSPLDFGRSQFLDCCSTERRTIQLELGKPEEKRKGEKRVNGIFWILLINTGIYVADHVFQVPLIKELYSLSFQLVRLLILSYFYMWNLRLYSASVFACRSHLSSNLFFLYIFGKLVEEEEGNFALWLSYILTGAGANLVSWLVLPRNTVSIGASGAVFGLFAISVLVKMSWDWRKILEVLILGQFVVEKVMEAAQASARIGGSFRGGGYAMQNVNHIAHLSGALIGVVLIWLLSSVPTPTDEK
ncbi:rhomboid-like protein 11, chloroplastic [Salvia splendens]|uniref:rhomboid-like protein 11, chloroplastic n=1 Tax=Salvia splendens TaxID=180675 RepID=UPI001C2785BB|nr:rhomboid-like protein 11, chloroplastic [Salvia splendens]